MKKIIIFVLCFYSCHITFCQVINGKVFDSSTHKTINAASIYFNGTFVGTTSDNEGNFELDISKNKHIPLTVSAIGYYSVNLVQLSEDKTIKVMLSPKSYVIDELKVKAKSLKRKKNICMKVFKEEFLGSDYEAMKCEIENENDITFNYDSDYDTLIAFARNPIRILNKEMGYRITYYLDKFVYCWKDLNTVYEGNLLFQDMAAVEGNQKQILNKMRFSVYQGSRMQFFRSLWADSVSSTQFSLKNEYGNVVRVKDIVKQINGNKYLSYPNKIIVNYDKKTSQLIFLNKLIYFDKSGYFEGSSISWSGEMGRQRIADTLPNEYVALDSNSE